MEQAYFQAIGHSHSSPRQAWRWLNSLWANMGTFRERLRQFQPVDVPLSTGSRRLTLLINTVAQCLTQLVIPEAVQLSMQNRFCCMISHLNIIRPERLYALYHRSSRFVLLQQMLAFYPMKR